MTAVGLFANRCCRADIKALMEGANAAHKAYASDKLAEMKHINTQLFAISFTVKVI